MKMDKFLATQSGSSVIYFQSLLYVRARLILGKSYPNTKLSQKEKKLTNCQNFDDNKELFIKSYFLHSF